MAQPAVGLGKFKEKACGLGQLKPDKLKMNFLAQMLGGGNNKNSSDAQAHANTTSGNVSGGQAR